MGRAMPARAPRSGPTSGLVAGPRRAAPHGHRRAGATGQGMERTMAHGPGDDSLKKGLKQRHLTMIAIGGVIGAGLFVGSGAVIGEVGPAAFLTYAITGVLIVLVMR